MKFHTFFMHSLTTGPDYVPYDVTGEEMTSITFTPNDQILPLPITILNDPSSTEPDETFNIFLVSTEVSQEFGIILMPSITTVTIKDSDGRYSFVQASGLKK